jgi:hypothetical protein
MKLYENVEFKHIFYKYHYFEDTLYNLDVSKQF